LHLFSPERRVSGGTVTEHRGSDALTYNCLLNLFFVQNPNVYSGIKFSPNFITRLRTTLKPYVSTLENMTDCRFRV
jgi:hypothetical protein